MIVHSICYTTIDTKKMNIVEGQLPIRSRRFVVRRGLQRLGVLAGSATVVPQVVSHMLTAPPKEFFSGESAEATVFPGWIESHVAIPFFISDKGHIPWLTEAVVNTPEVASLTKEFFAYLEQQRSERKRLGLGDLISHALHIIQRDLPTIDPTEALHVASIMVAGTLNTLADSQSIQVMGADFKKTGATTSRDYFWNKDSGLAITVFPRLFGWDEAFPNQKNDSVESRFTGEDRAVHFAHHFFLVTEYLYANQHQLSEKNTIIPAIKFLMGFGKTPEEQALIFSGVTGFSYEISNLKHTRNWPIPFLRNRDDIDEGLFDITFQADLKGNMFGAVAGCALWERVIQNQPLEPVLEELNNPKFSRFETSPTL